MALILNIDTSTETASVSLATNGEVIASAENNIQKEHAAFLHNAIKNIFEQADKKPADLDAIAVTEGPGSYTGLRVGMASAKGLCYALKKPFITIVTLEAMALSAITEHKNSNELFCPMIDARRLEVYTALYDAELNEISSPSAVVLNEDFLKEKFKLNKIVFCGSGIQKFSQLVQEEKNAFFLDEINTTVTIAKLSQKKFLENDFTELAHSQPLYVKEFFNGN